MTTAWVKPEHEEKAALAIAAGGVAVAALVLMALSSAPEGCPQTTEVVRYLYTAPIDPLVGVSAWRWPMTERLSPYDSDAYRATSCPRLEEEAVEPQKAEEPKEDKPERKHHRARHFYRHYRHWR